MDTNNLISDTALLKKISEDAPCNYRRKLSKFI